LSGTSTINSASANDLKALKGIGEADAKKIVREPAL
jgi:DNA uptake protein ComE-like DNA-binding protein